MEHNEHDKNGTGDGESDDTAQQQHSVQPCQLHQLYSVRWYGTGKTWDSSHDRACHRSVSTTRAEVLSALNSILKVAGGYEKLNV